MFRKKNSTLSAHRKPWRFFASLALGVIITGSLLFAFSSTPVHAQQKYTGLMIRTRAELGGFTFEFYVEPGQQVCDEFIVQHDFQSEQTGYTYYTLVSDLEIDSKTRQPVFPTKTLVLDHEFSLASWVSVSHSEVYLPTWGTEIPLSFCITVPESAQPGSHFATILMSNLTEAEYLGQEKIPEAKTDFQGSTIASRSGVNLLVTVSGNIDTNIEVSSFEARDIDFNGAIFGIFEYLPLNFVATLQNDGNQFVKPAGNITVHTGDLTQPVKTFPFNPEAIRILPSSKQQFISLWDEGMLLIDKLPREIIDPETNAKNTVYDYQLAVDPSKLGEFRFGRYFATLQMTYYDINGDFQRLPDYTVQFWVIPWKIIVAVVLSVVSFIYVRRMLKKQNGRKSKQ